MELAKYIKRNNWLYIPTQKSNENKRIQLAVWLELGKQINNIRTSVS